ncbi:S-adenosyl-L-methionine-dependent methyltransferase [Hypoxylon fuscum]|nr:S-adenosyl-L-methionine-dependent methyltransferase [Hypoxylon fuscum]
MSDQFAETPTAASGTTPEPSTAAVPSTTITSLLNPESPQAATETEKTTVGTTTEATTADTTAEATTEIPAEIPAETAETTSAAAPTPQAGNPDILPASYWAQAPRPVHESDDEDSAYGDDNASSTASLTASILEYRTLHGRTFHSERGNAQSWNPNDAQHNETMDILHHVSTLMQDGKIYLAPLGRDIQKVLDVGCGTGIWAIDFADLYPGAEVIGVDISPSQPQWIPPNLRFEIDDVTQPWTYGRNSFDYIHMRWLVGAIEDWDKLFRECFNALQPGGYLESKESSAVIQSDDGTVADDSALAQWGKVFKEAGTKSGKSFQVVEEGLQRKAMEAAGFVDIEERDMKTPFGAWPADHKNREIGQYNQLALAQDIEGFLVHMWSQVLGWAIEEIQVYAAHLRHELRSKKIHAYYPQKVLIGRKPKIGEIP